MRSTNIDIDIIDFIDLLNITLSSEFVEKWRYKYSEKFIKHFQFRLLKSISNQKVLKIDTLYTFLNKKCRYCREQILNFFESVEIDNYKPLISGNLTKHLL